MPLSEFWITVALYVLPLYFANGGAMLFGTLGNFGKTPLDFGKNFFDGKPVLGKGKTFLGTAAGLLVGFITVYATCALFAQDVEKIIPNYALVGTLLTIGAIAGDVIASFFKRRFGKKQGQPVFLLDQLDFALGGIILASPVFIPGLLQLAVIIILTIVIHRLANFIAFKIKLKKVPW